MGRHSVSEPDDSSDQHRDAVPAFGESYEGGDFDDRFDDDGQFHDDEAVIDPARYLRHPGYDDEVAPAEAAGGDAQDDDAPWLTGRDRKADRYRGGRRWQLSDQWRGGHRNDAGRRGVSVGVVAALMAVIVVVGSVILWRFFGNSLSHRFDVAAGRCVNGELSVAVVADPSIADHLQEFADRFSRAAKPVGDRCVSVQVKSVDADAVISGFIGDWPTELGERPALWVPGSSVSTARLQESVGRETISDARSLVTSPVLLALRPQLKPALEKQTWATLPDLQSRPDALAALNLPDWGSLRLALPIGGNGDAVFLAAEAVAATATPPGAPASAAGPALRALTREQPDLADKSLAEAMNVLLRPADPATAPVHAVVTTEQQLFTRGKSMPDTAMLGSWLPPGPVPVADYPTVLLSGPWLTPEQVSAASEFARFARKPSQLAELAKAGFRVEGIRPPSSDVTDFAAVPTTLSPGDDTLRAALAALLTTPARSVAVTIVVDQSMTTDEGGKTRLAHVLAALADRIGALPVGSAVGLWSFDGTEGRVLVPFGSLDDEVDGAPRAAVLTGALDNIRSTSGGAVSFTTLRLAYHQALSNFRAGQNNSVLVITSGPHTDQTLDGPGLEDFVRRAIDPERPVAVNVIDFDGDPDQSTWQAVAQLSAGHYQNPASSASPELADAVAAVLG